MYNKENKLLFIHVPKTGGTIIKARMFSNKEHHHTIFSKFEESMENIDRLFKFCCLRDPYDRHVSAFIQLLSKRKKRKFNEYDKPNPESFRRWMENVWYPHFSNKEIKSDDNFLKNWMSKESVFGFGPNIYHNYFTNQSGDMGSIDFFLDFNYLRDSLEMLKVEYYNKMGENLTSRLNGIQNNNKKLNNYKNFWDDYTVDLFKSLNQKDILFYKKMNIGFKARIKD